MIFKKIFNMNFSENLTYNLLTNIFSRYNHKFSITNLFFPQKDYFNRTLFYQIICYLSPAMTKL